MSVFGLVLLWLVAGAATELWTTKDAGGDDEGDTPWWLTALLVLSWPLLLATRFINLKVTLETFEESEDA